MQIMKTLIKCRIRGIWFGPALFANVPFIGHPALTGSCLVVPTCYYIKKAELHIFIPFCVIGEQEISIDLYPGKKLSYF